MTVMVIAGQAGALCAHLAPRLAGERLVAAEDAGAVDDALAHEPPEVVFAIRDARVGLAAYRRALGSRSLRYWHVGGSGYEWLGRWDGARVTVTNGLGVLAPYLADTALGAIIALNNGLVAYRDDQVARVWAPRPFRPLEGQVLAIVGAGAIGQALAPRAKAVGMEVVGLTRAGRALEGFDRVAPLSALDAVLGEADVVSCHLRLVPETAGLFDAGRFAAIKPGALFLNSARGGCVVEEALLAALESGRLGGAWLDVFQTEPLPAESALWAAPGLFMTPHASDQIEGWDLRFADHFAENLGRWRRGETLVNLVPAPD